MSDSTTETTVDPAGQETAENSVDQPEAPEWVTKELERARKEAAKYRDRARAAAEETEAKLRAEFATREGELTARIEELTEQVAQSTARASVSEKAVTKLRLAVEHGVPADRIESFVKRLVGDTDEELAADAKELAATFAPPKVAEDRSQGHGAVPLNSPTLVTALQHVAQRRHR